MPRRTLLSLVVVAAISSGAATDLTAGDSRQAEGTGDGSHLGRPGVHHRPDVPDGNAAAGVHARRDAPPFPGRAGPTRGAEGREAATGSVIDRRSIRSWR